MSHMKSHVLAILCACSTAQAKFSIGSVAEKVLKAKDVADEAKGVADNLDSIMQADQCLRCLVDAPEDENLTDTWLHQKVDAPEDENLTDTSLHQKVEKYFSNFDECELFHGSLRCWSACSTTMEEIVSMNQWIVCREIHKCRGRTTGFDALHGLCLHQCENHVHDNTVTTTCEEGLLVKAGLTHPRVCGSDIPKELLLDYMGPQTLIANSVLAVVVALSDVAMEFSTPIPTTFGPEPFLNLLRFLVQAWVVVYIIAVAHQAMQSAGHSCRFVVLAEPLQFAPFMFAYSQMLSLLFAHLHQLDKFSKYVGGGISWFCCFELSYQVVWQIMRLVMAIVTIPLGAVMIGLAISGLPVIASLIHFILLPIICILCVSVPLLMLAPAFFKWAEDREDHFFDAFKTRIGCVLVLTCVNWFWLLFGAAFLMYYHGDWTLINKAFLDMFEIPDLTLPTFDFIKTWESFQEAMGQLLSFDFSLSMPDVYDLSLFYHGIFFALRGVTGLIRRCGRAESE